MLNQVFTICLLFIYSSSQAQDSTLIHTKFYNRQATAMTILGGWAGLNLVASPLIKTKSMYSWPHFHQMNFNWNIVNAGIASFGFISAKKKSKLEWTNLSLAQERRKLQKILAINIGLDLCYMLVGSLLIKNASKLDDSSKNRNMGFGNSLIVQGAYLFIFDLAFLRKIRK